MFSWIVLTALMASKIASHTTTITSNQIVVGPIEQSSISDGIIIEPGVYWSILNNFCNEADSVQVGASGGFYIFNSDNSEYSQFISDSITNYGVISIGNVLGVTKYELSGDQMINEGQLFLLNPSQCELSGKDKWYNSGTIVIEGQNSNPLSTLSMDSSSDSETLANIGDICLTDVYYEVTTPLAGSGCIHINGDAQLLISKLFNNDFENTIYLNGSESKFNFNPSGATYNVAGFGGGNFIEIPSMKNPGTFEYNAQSGILTITADGHFDNFNIGVGYDPDYFSIVSESSAISYGPPPPNGIPSNCGPCPPFPSAPGSAS